MTPKELKVFDLYNIRDHGLGESSVNCLIAEIHRLQAVLDTYRRCANDILCADTTKMPNGTEGES